MRDLIEDIEHSVGKSPEKELCQIARGGSTNVVTNATGKIDSRVVILRPLRPGCRLGSQHHISKSEVLEGLGGFICRDFSGLRG